MRSLVKRLEVARIRVCGRCGRGGAELRGADGESLVVPLDPVRTRQLADGGKGEDLRSLTDLAVECLAASRVTVSEVVLDLSDGRLRALVSVVRGSDTDVVACPADEGVALAIRGEVKLYATDEALAHAASRSPTPEREGGPDTVH